MAKKESVLKFIYSDPSQKVDKYTDVGRIDIIPETFNITFAQMIPPEYDDKESYASVVSKLAMSPQHAKTFLAAFEERVKDYEKEFGEIKSSDEK